VNSVYNYSKEMTLDDECSIVSKIFEGIEVKVNSNGDCCEFTGDYGSIYCTNKHITCL